MDRPEVRREREHEGAWEWRIEGGERDEGAWEWRIEGRRERER